VQHNRHSSVEVSLMISKLFKGYKPAIALSLGIGLRGSLGVTSLETDWRGQSQSGKEDAGDDLETHFTECGDLVERYFNPAGFGLHGSEAVVGGTALLNGLTTSIQIASQTNHLSCRHWHG
jgi:hypothetical protein